MSTLIERVAAAIAAASMDGSDGNMGDEAALVLARAAIEAMLEPGEVAVLAHQVVPDGTDFRDRALANWQAMIDAALAEQR